MSKQEKNPMPSDDFQVVFKKRSITSVNEVNADRQLQDISTATVKALSPYGEELARLKDTLTETFIKMGSVELKDLYVLRKQYIGDKAYQINDFSAGTLLKFSRAFDGVISSALYSMATEMTKADARKWDEELYDLNHEFGIMFSCKRKEGSDWLPVPMEEVAFIDDELAGTWTTKEPYANLDW